MESFVQTPDGPGNVKSIDLLRGTVKVSLDSAPEPLKSYHNCEGCVLRNGKGSREGIEIPERPARYVEEKEEEELFKTPILSTPFYMDKELEDAPVREKIGVPESGDGGKSRRRHRGGRRRNKSAQPKAEQAMDKAEKSSEKKEQPRESKENKAPRQQKQHKQPKQQKQPSQPKPEAKGENKAAGGEGSEEAKHRRRPHHRGGRRRNKGGGGGEGAAPKNE